MKHLNFIASIAAFLTLAAPAFATDVNVVGLFGTKALVSINGGEPRTLSVGQRTAEGVVLIAVDRETATLDIDGKRRTLGMGQHASSGGSGGGSVTLKADGQGHFVTSGQINGGTVRFLVDTGATMVSIPAAEARRLGIKYTNAPRGFVQTANGAAGAWKVKLDTVRVGDVTINNVDAVIMEAGLPVTLLGMSFLNRTQMRRDGETMVLTKRY
jgi:aspartyl protease family protein